MTDRPIIFSAPMVRALLDGRKTQTRRVLKPQPPEDVQFVTVASNGSGWAGFDRLGIGYAVSAPYAPGDQIWVRENFIGARGYDRDPPSKWGNKPIWYPADGDPDRETWWHLSDRVRPSIHMPRWASRITLTVTDVRVQRLQEITAEDCTAEGVPFEADALAPYEWSISRFADIWKDIHGPGAWEKNPWVAALTFTAQCRNIDQ